MDRMTVVEIRWIGSFARSSIRSRCSRLESGWCETQVVHSLDSGTRKDQPIQ